MLSGTMLRQGDIVLLPVPFTDLSSQKKRPTVIISSDYYNNANEDMVVVALTSNVSPREFSIVLTADDMESGLLKVTSMIRADKIYTLNKSIVLKTVGRIKQPILIKIKDCILELIEHSNKSK